MPKWRKKTSLWSPPIYKDDWPKLIKMMKDNGVYVQIDDRVKFFYGEYEITGKEIRRVWQISKSQLRTLKDKVISGMWDEEA